MSALGAETHHGHGPANRGRRVERTSAPLLVRFPRQSPRAAVVVLHDECGVTEEVETVCRTFADDGYLAVAPLLYYETGGPAFRSNDRGRALARFAGLRTADLAEDIGGAVRHAESRLGIPHAAIAAAGVGAGGHLAAWGAVTHHLTAACAVDPQPGPWPELDCPETPAARLGDHWLTARSWVEAVGFFDTRLAGRSR